MYIYMYVYIYIHTYIYIYIYIYYKQNLYKNLKVIYKNKNINFFFKNGGSAR